MNAMMLALAGFALVAAPTFAQDGSVIAPQAYQTQFENDWVKVTRVHYAPHETLAEHDHPARPTIYIYLNDGGPVLFKHQHGESGDYAATRPGTTAGAYRLAGPRKETHVVENRSELPNDFLQVELKIAVDPTTFTGRRSRDMGVGDTPRVEFESAQLRIVRLLGAQTNDCHGPHPSIGSALVVDIRTGGTTWLNGESSRGSGTTSGSSEQLMIQFIAGRH